MIWGWDTETGRYSSRFQGVPVSESLGHLIQMADSRQHTAPPQQESLEERPRGILVSSDSMKSTELGEGETVGYGGKNVAGA